MKNVILSCVVAALAVPSVSFAQDFSQGQMPQQARPGQCYARKLVPATYRTEAMQVVTHDAYEQVQVTEPVFRVDQQQVITSDPYKRFEVTEPTFRNEAQTIVTRPAHERLVATPATLGTRTETIVVREPRLVWRAGSNLSGVRRLDPSTGEIFCLVEEAAVTQTVSRVVQTAPARVSRQAVPAQTQTIQRRVLVAPATVREVVVPGSYQTVAVETLVNPATERRGLVAPQSGTVNRQVLETPERYEWVAVDCENVQYNSPSSGPRAGTGYSGPAPSGYSAPRTVSGSGVQRALASRGFYRGPIDGVFGARTVQALREFQRRNGLPVSGQLTEETVRRLGL